MTREALPPVADDVWNLGVPLVYRIEHRALAWIDRRQFDDIAALHPTNIGIVVEINRTRLARRDLTQLETCL